MQNLPDDLGRGAEEGPPACEQLIENDPEGIDVRRGADGMPIAAGLLRRHVRRSAEHHIAPSRLGIRRPRGAGQSEVRDHHPVGLVQENVRGFQVAVKNTFGMCRCESQRKFAHNLHRPPLGKGLV